MFYRISQGVGSGIYWKSTDEEIGVSGEWTANKSQASLFSEKVREEYVRTKGQLPEGMIWECRSRRHKDAILIQSAVNPSGIALSLHEAFREVIFEGGDTKAQRDDVACRLILHQLAHLLDMTGGYDLTDYRKYTEACEEKAKLEGQ